MSGPAGQAARECGACNLCCKLLGISDPQLNKPADTWCSHVKKGAGCGIYERRPIQCRAFVCGWLAGAMGDHWRPDRSKMILSSTDRPDMVLVHVDPAHAGRWREPRYLNDLKALSRRGTTVLIGAGADSAQIMAFTGEVIERRRRPELFEPQGAHASA
jgi:hypothetical protein